MPEYKRMDELVSEQQKNQVGVAAPPASFGMTALSAINGYAEVLDSAYKYDLTRSGPPADACSSGGMAY
jgi:hypothetical protein